jgi:hypothetical protein
LESSASLLVWMFAGVPALAGGLPSSAAVVSATTSKLAWFCPSTFEHVAVKVKCPTLPSVTVWPARRNRTPPELATFGAGWWWWPYGAQPS